MPENPIVPPTRKPVSELPTPDQTVSFYTELVGRDDPAYVQNSPMKRGTLYSTIVGANQDVIARFPQLFFLRERKFQLSDQLVLWDWATDENAHDTYNSTVTYIANNVNYPAYTRVYTVRRELYEQEPTVTIGDPLPGIIAVEIVEAGAGYTYATGRISGDSNITVNFTLTPEGGLLNGIISNTGEDVIADGTSIIVEGDGSGGIARSQIQPSSCVLTSQQKEELQDQDPLQHELVKVTRVYETLPGPFLTTTRFDKDGMLVTTKTRRNITTDITDGDDVSGGVWTQTWHKATDSFVSEETVETRPIPGNEIVSTKIEDDGNILAQVRQLVETSTVVSSETLVAGVWTKKYGTEVDDSSLVKVHDASNLVSYQVTESRTIPGNYIYSSRFRSDGSTIHVQKRLQKKTDIVPGGDLSAGTLTLIRLGEVSDLVSWEIIETSEVPGPTVHGEHVDERYGIVIDIEKTIVPDGTAGGIIAGAYVEVQPQNEWQSIQIASRLDTDSLPEDVTWYGSQYHGSFPPELVTGWPTNPYGVVIEWAEATCGCQEKFASVLQANFTQYSGEVKARYTEQFYNGPPPDDVTITQFFPEAHRFGFAFAAVCGCGSDTTSRITAISPQYYIPLCLHDDFTVCVGGGAACAGAPFSWTFAATNPAVLPHGDYIMLKPYIERWRFGVFRRVLTEILVP